MSRPSSPEVQRVSLEEDRFSRLRLITWWNQEKIAATRVLVVGAGALGNEILKNLALLGFQKMIVVDLDRVENSNLSRSVLYSEQDIGKPKASAAADAVRRILPGAQITPINANLLHDVGLGVFEWADVIIAGLDNREARLWINRAAWKLNKPWVDGAIEGINGVARVFLPGKAPCYECTLGEKDWEILEKRLSCNLLTRAEMEGGKVPTTPTIASIIAGIQVQEAVKLIHGLPVLESAGYVFEGLNHSSYRVTYTENPDCMSHHTYDEVVRVSGHSRTLTLHQLWSGAAKQLDSKNVVLEFSRDVIHKLVCPQCHAEEELFAAVGSVKYERGKCSQCGEMRVVVTMHSYDGTGEIGARSLESLGLPPFDIFVARTQDERELALLIAGDAEEVLGLSKEKAAVLRNS
jgi:molybdopterin/thiamine biosynthesis adenylyltransferase